MPANLNGAEYYHMVQVLEASHRQMNEVRTRTPFCNPVIRLLFVGLTFILFNLYIAICLKNPLVPIAHTWLILRRLAHMIAHAVEKLFDLADIIFVTHLSHFRELLILGVATAIPERSFNCDTTFTYKPQPFGRIGVDLFIS